MGGRALNRLGSNPSRKGRNFRNAPSFPLSILLPSLPLPSLPPSLVLPDSKALPFPPPAFDLDAAAAAVAADLSPAASLSAPAPAPWLPLTLHKT